MSSLIIYPDGTDKPGLEIPTANGFVSRVVSAVADANIPDAERVAKTLNLIDGLGAVVQYRGLGNISPRDWLTLAAFDSRYRADKYAAACSDSTHWEYRVADLGDQLEDTA